MAALDRRHEGLGIQSIIGDKRMSADHKWPGIAPRRDGLFGAADTAFGISKGGRPTAYPMRKPPGRRKPLKLLSVSYSCVAEHDDAPKYEDARL